MMQDGKQMLDEMDVFQPFLRFYRKGKFTLQPDSIVNYRFQPFLRFYALRWAPSSSL